mmetsp:Transcript_21071/g.54769  ORF Transcript_21071/g.54769 Transcript_21071/m.54769 type:complete len:80 (+) Transcript_21071:2326-2565(+)
MGAMPDIAPSVHIFDRCLLLCVVMGMKGIGMHALRFSGAILYFSISSREVSSPFSLFLSSPYLSSFIVRVNDDVEKKCS